MTVPVPRVPPDEHRCHCPTCREAELWARRAWRAPRDGGYHPAESIPEPDAPPVGPSGTSSRGGR